MPVHRVNTGEVTRISQRIQLARYLVMDSLTALAGWVAFQLFLCQFRYETGPGLCISSYSNPPYLLIPTGIILFWLFLYYLTGYYRDVFRKSRLGEFFHTAGNSVVGAFLVLMMTGTISPFAQAPNALSGYLQYLAFHFILTYSPRLMLTTITTHRIQRGQIGFNTLLIGSSRHAANACLEIMNQPKGSGNRFVGFVHVNQVGNHDLEELLPNLGGLDNIHEVVTEHRIKEVIIALEPAENGNINRIINKLIDLNLEIKAIPSMYDILTGKVRMGSILGTPLISVSYSLIPAWQENVKSMMDYLVAVFALLVSLPLSLVLIVGVKLSSPGPVFYSHERIGRYGKPFVIYKFRSMYQHAEKNGPELSSKHDDRITPLGRFMRKARLDEIPNFFNVLKGEMSLVGPRPERKHFIDQIIKKAPHYLHLLKVKPGITSWGQVKYGYAENVDQMIQRLKYDLIYIDNMSLFVDIKIIIHTILIILRRKGV